jgi:glycerol-3-phosphate acyltransferase PlsY
LGAETLTGPFLGLLLGYAFGSIPFGIILTRLGGAGDLRTIGSGNIGATNVLRTGRKSLAAGTLILDMLKGTAAMVAVQALIPGSVTYAAIGAFLGHLFPIWLRFSGGKGVATFLGIVLGYALADHLSWVAVLTYALVWLAALGVTRYSSVGGMAAAISAPMAAAVLHRFDIALVFIGFALLVLWKHRANLGRLIAGTEPRVGQNG